MQQVTMNAQKREKITKGTNRQLRIAGRIPAVIYGGTEEPITISIEDKELHHILKSSAGTNVLIDLEISNGSTPNKQFVIIKDIQKEPVKGNFIHIDFYRISMDKELTTWVPIEAVGVAQGVQLGGILEYVMREVFIQCLPTLIPDKIQVDVTELQIRDSIHIRDLKVPEGVELLDEPDKNVISIVPPVAEEVVEPTTEITEPEVIEKGKMEEEEGVEEEGAEGKEKKPAEAKGAAPAPGKGAAPGTEKKPAEKKPAEKKG